MELTLAPLDIPKSRWKCFVASWSAQTLIVSTLLMFNVLFPHQVQQAKAYTLMHIVAPYERPKITEAQPVNPRLVVKVKPEPIMVARLEPPPLPVPKAKEPEVKAPYVKLTPGNNLPLMPKAPKTNVIATNTFPQPTNVMPTTTKPASQVQTGGFGDPNGIPTTGDGKHSPNINAKGNPGLPFGPGYGTGTGGAFGVAGVGIVGNGKPGNGGTVQSSGFDRQAAAPVRKVEPEVVSAGTPVEILSKPKPTYTEEGRKAKVEGEVVLTVLFSATGQARVVAVLQGLGYGLDEQAVRAVEQIKFNPAKHAGQPVDSTARVHIVFELAS